MQDRHRPTLIQKAVRYIKRIIKYYPLKQPTFSTMLFAPVAAMTKLNKAAITATEACANLQKALNTPSVKLALKRIEGKI